MSLEGEPQKDSSLALRVPWSPLHPCKTQTGWKWEGEAPRAREPRLWAESGRAAMEQTRASESDRLELQVPLSHLPAGDLGQVP